MTFLLGVPIPIGAIRSTSALRLSDAGSVTNKQVSKYKYAATKTSPYQAGKASLRPITAIALIPYLYHTIKRACMHVTCNGSCCSPAPTTRESYCCTHHLRSNPRHPKPDSHANYLPFPFHGKLLATRSRSIEDLPQFTKVS